MQCFATEPYKGELLARAGNRFQIMWLFESNCYLTNGELRKTSDPHGPTGVTLQGSWFPFC